MRKLSLVVVDFGDVDGEVKKTIVHHDNAVHKGHKEWLKKLHDKHHHVK